MAILATYINQYTGEDIADAYFWAASTAFDFARRRAKIVYHVHPTRDAAYAGRPPMGTVVLEVGERPGDPIVDDDGGVVVPGLPSFDEMVAANAAAYAALAAALDDMAMTQTHRFPDASKDVA